MLFAIAATAETSPQHYVSVEYLIDGKKSACKPFSVELRFDGQTFRPKVSGQRFEVPELFNKPSSEWKDNDSVDLSLSCDGNTYAFSAHPGFLGDEQWTLGTAHPVYGIHEYWYTHQLDRGAILDYVIFEGEPGIIMFWTEPGAPGNRISALQKKQATASGVRARNIAYELAVYRHDYEKNRDYLLDVMNRCLAKPKDSLQEDDEDECDDDLLKFVANLYWRGDDRLLSRLLNVAEGRSDVLDDVGRFYSDLLQSRTKDMLRGMEELPREKQSLVCHLAYKDHLRFDPPELEQVQTALRDHHTAVAENCLHALRDNSQ